MNEMKKRILEDENLPEFKVAGTVYKGRQPMFQPVGNKIMKVHKGVPFVKVRDLEEGES